MQVHLQCMLFLSRLQFIVCPNLPNCKLTYKFIFVFKFIYVDLQAYEFIF